MTKVCFDCGKCCLETEMILSQEDIQRIIKEFKGDLKQGDFCYIGRDGYMQLRNKEHHCYFYDETTKKCNIYENRPQGCKFYPLIYDLKENECTFDGDCPKPSLIYPDKSKIKKTCLEIMKYLKDQFKIDI